MNTTDIDQDGRLFSYKEIATMGATSARTVRRWVAEGKLGCFKEGNVTRVSLAHWRTFRQRHDRPAKK